MAAAAVAFALDPRLHGLAIVGATVLGSVWVGAGLRRHRLPRGLFRLLAVTMVTNLVFVLGSVTPVILDPSGSLAEPSHADPGLVFAALMLAATLIVALSRRQRPSTVLVELVTIAVGAGLVIGSLLVRGGTGGEQLATEVGSAAAALLLGWAALHPSVCRIGDSKPSSHGLRTTSAVVLGLTSLIASLVLTMHRFTAAFSGIDDTSHLSVAVMACGAVLTTLVIACVMQLLGRARSQADAATAALDERSRMLEECESRYRQLIEKVPAVVVVFRLGQHQPIPVYVSPQSERMFGVSPEQWLADPSAIGARIHPEDLAQLDSELARREDGRSTNHPEFRFTRPDGEEVWVRDVSGLIMEEPGGRYLQAMLVDITEYKRAECERQQMEHELRLSQKLEAVGQLAAGIAHEINTPIQFVGDTFNFLQNAFSDLLALTEVQSELRRAAEAHTVSPELLARAREAEDFADLTYLSDRVPAAVARGVDGVARVGAIVRAMRVFAYPPTSEKSPVDVAATVHDALAVAMNAYKYIAEVETDIDVLPDVTCNGGEIGQVFLNLIVNAAHAIESVVGDSGRRGKITVRAEQDGDDVLVSIADTGGGIPAEVAARVFDPFFTTKEVGRGTGQGLALARTMIVERHGGTLTFDTVPGTGTTFHVRLPISAARTVLEAA
ncbi:PAS domain-containing sensor histidine kinase [Solirubrobacter ginsenosidimutans]|uniref:PAS domain-containing sensor histidine kinase n=1 Tax=Solirubrobacter ginsenosidimutans TaxID=490573 RepID=UPI0022CE152F|nr:ATP-binding protein [Solirubrobacter ginsenosidimutans]